MFRVTVRLCPERFLGSDQVLKCEQDSKRKDGAGSPEEGIGCVRMQNTCEALQSPRWLGWRGSEQCLLKGRLSPDYLSAHSGYHCEYGCPSKG